MIPIPQWPVGARASFVVCLSAVTCVAILSGCCPPGDAVLSSLTLPAEEQGDGCRVKAGPRLTSDARDLTGEDLSRIPDRSTAAAILELVGRAALEGDERREVKYAYAAVYACGSGDSEVGVSAVMFRKPIDAVRASRLRESHMGVMFKGQLAAIVWTRGDECDECYEALRARTEQLMGSGG